MKNNLQKAGLFIVKSMVFSLVFWTMWIYVLRPFTSTTQASASSQAQNTDAYMKKYWEQMAISEAHQNRMTAILAKQEEQGRRFDAVLTMWEKQNKANK